MSTPAGEHVLPRWLVSRMFSQEDGPYQTYRGDSPERKRDGSIRERTSFGAIKLPACQTCNSELNRRFEGAKIHVLDLLQRQGTFRCSDPQAVQAIALWLLKTWVFRAHPLTRYSFSHHQKSLWHNVPRNVFTWTVTGDQPPPGLSLWLGLRPNERDERPRRPIWLPQVVADGEATQFRSHQAGLCEIEVSLVRHPGWEIAHPGERDGEVIRLWPNPPNALDLTALTEGSPVWTRWLECGQVRFAPGMFNVAKIPPLGPDVDLADMMLRCPRAVQGVRI